jgi:hypothetical protein
MAHSRQTLQYLPTGERVPCVPLYAVTDPESDTVEFLAAGTLLRFRGTPLLATAAHVIDNGQRFILLIAGPEKPVHLNRPALATPVRDGMTRETDPLDFCVVALTEEEAESLSTRCRFVEWEQEALLDIPAVPLPHRIMGYPDVDNDANDDAQTLAANAQRIDVVEDRDLIVHSHSQDYSKHPRWYIALRYDPRQLEKQPTKPKVPTLHGFSGGSIWRTDGSDTQGFAGIVTESNPPRRTGERLVYGFRSTAMNDLLYKWTEDGFV